MYNTVSARRSTRCNAGSNFCNFSGCVVESIAYLPLVTFSKRMSLRTEIPSDDPVPRKFIVMDGEISHGHDYLQIGYLLQDSFRMVYKVGRAHQYNVSVLCTTIVR